MIEFDRKKIEGMSCEEFQQYFLLLAREEAENDKYCAYILDVAKRIIDTKDYYCLYRMIESYDKIVKEYGYLKYGYKYKHMETIPYWSYCFGVKEEN